MTALEDTSEVEGCAWLLPTAPKWRSVRPCGRPSTAAVTDGRLVLRVCQRHHVRTLELGWREVLP